eukprot:CAMPEP_0182422446 /NCGR_PEP_ID=MMETSP1167-20130531/8142_1 /TAXON_ID=2988 /ORGANISM="Mallomonas Sp, Strain CCMP3275" /LENGTH=854 /DNA_ID=CAMNT_0024600513 /DNA_START=216 /DNA_END=2780 /DNA_ORIENTATION=+
MCKACLIGWQHSFCPLCRGGLPDQEEWVLNRTLDEVIQDRTKARSTLKLPLWSIQTVSSLGSLESNSTVSFFGSKVAVKRFHSTDIFNPISSDSIWKNLRHPNIIQIYGAVESSETCSIVLFEHCEAGCLSHLLHSQQFAFSPLEMIRILLGVAAGLEYLHSNCLIHGNMNASNVLMTTVADGFTPENVKLSDFNMIQKSLAHKVATHQTVAYTAPELLAHAASSSRSRRICTSDTDMYSFGVLAWELLAGEIPWGGLPDDKITAAVLNNECLDTPVACSASLKILMDRCLQRKNRPSASEMRLQLELLATGRPLSLTYNSSIRTIDKLTLSAAQIALSDANNVPDNTPPPPPSSPSPSSMLSCTPSLSVSLETVIAVSLRAHDWNFTSLHRALTHILSILLADTTGDDKYVIQSQNEMNKTIDKQTERVYARQWQHHEESVSSKLKDICIASLSAMKIPTAEDTIIQLSCRILTQCIVFDPSLSSLLTDMLAIPVILEQLSARVTCAHVSESALSLLAHICTHHSTGKQMMMSQSGCELTVRAMRVDMHQIAVISQACALITVLAISADDQMLTRLLACNCCDVVICALEKHGENEIVIEQGLCALAALSCVTSEAGRLRFQKSFTCDTVTSQLSKHATNARVVENVMHIVTSLCNMNACYKDHLGESGMCVAILVSLTLHQSDFSVVSATCDAFNALVTHHSENLTRVFAADVCPLLLSVMKQNDDRPEVFLRICASIARLAYTTNMCYQEQIAASGLCGAIVRGLQRHMQHRETAVQAIGAIVAMANFKDADSRTALMESKACDVIPVVMQQHCKVRDVIVPGLWALELLANGRTDSMRLSRSSMSTVSSV